MIRLLFLALFLCAVPSESFSRTVRLGESSSFGRMPTERRPPSSNVSCYEDADCPDNRECVALRCESVCKNNPCANETYCIPSPQRAHAFECVECVRDDHCPDGFFCGDNYVCKKRDPCLKAVCSPAAPHCMPKPYKTLPYTCVQCLSDEHCPPVAGLTRKCVDGYCLFNVEGNIPEKKKDASAP